VQSVSEDQQEAASGVSGDADRSTNSDSDRSDADKFEMDLASMRVRLEQRESELALVLRKCDDLEQHNQLVSSRLLEQTQTQAQQSEVDSLRAALALSEEKNERLQAELRLDQEEKPLNLSSASERFDHSSSSSEDLNRSLQEAEDKITALLKVKEKFAEVSQHKTELELNLSRLESDVEALSLQSQAATACSVIPLAILLLAIIIAYLPLLSSIFGTADDVSTMKGLR
jgi:hypothetical protein